MTSPLHRATGGIRPVLAVVCLVLAGMVASGCVPTGERPSFADEAGPADDSGASSGSGVTAGMECPAAGDQFAGFTTRPIAVDDAEGVLGQCVLVADTPELRQRGFSGVPDTGGHAGMIFAFPEDTMGSFWMGNTHMPLTIAFVDSAGATVAVFDMEPCPDAVDCPSYFPEVPYRWALEVPQGTLAQFGLTEGATLDPTTLPIASQ